MTLFEIPEWETLRVAGRGRTRTGKTTFFAANAQAPIYAIDADKGFVRTRLSMNGLFPDLGGEVYHPSNKGCLQPLLIHQEAEQNVFTRDIKTIVVDSVTKIYGFNTRPAVMAGRLSTVERERYGFSKNKASNLQNKADAIQVLTYMAAYGTHIFYIWHEQETVDMESAKQGKLDKVMRETMSPEEKKRLLTSVDIVLDFSFDRGKYAVTVSPETRGFGQEPNTGFTIYDTSGNYWRGALARLYGLIYTTFSGQEEAVNWAMQTLGKEDRVEVAAFYDEVKVRARPGKPSDMWVAWMLAVEEKYNARHNGQEKKPIEVQKPVIENNQDPDPDPDLVVEEALMAEYADGLGADPPDSFGTGPEDEYFETSVMPDNDGPAEPLVDNNGDPLTYGDGDLVREDDIAKYKQYESRFGYPPANEKILHRSQLS